MSTRERRVPFSLGRVVATPGALEAMRQSEADSIHYLRRHVTGDWGDLAEEDRAANDEATLVGNRILSSYTLPDGEKMWIITEGDRSATTFLLPSEY